LGVGVRRLALYTVLCALGAVLAGAWITSAGSVAALRGAGGEGAAVLGAHRIVSVMAGFGAVALGLMMGGALRWWLIGAVVAAAAPGGMLEGAGAKAWAGVAHAVASSALFSVVVAAWAMAGWEGEVETVTDDGSPSLLSLAKATWVILLFQSAMGALYRHQVAWLMPHVGGALIVMSIAMYAGIAALGGESMPRAVKRQALGLVILTGVQMLLGLGAYLYRVAMLEQGAGEASVIFFSVMHVSVGAMTTASCALMGIQVMRHVRQEAGPAVKNGVAA
jgi:hypothetical protein